ncbi:MAG: hypothetical protein M0P43_04735 [Arcobacteraceae bacterium]|nr:hypothetical protein [Arcobacteraceae bacterium]MDY0327621.1 hypothetical protein [Arcobacteraceae bacterium]
MYSNIFLSVGLVIAGIIFASATYKSYSDVQEAKQIQENYEIISEIKSLLASEYNKSTKEITRDEIMAHLPSGEYWEKVLLINRDLSSTLANDELINIDGNIVISSEEKIKLLALRSKLRTIQDLSDYTEDQNKKITYDVWVDKQSPLHKDNIISFNIDKVIEIAYINKDSTNFETDFNNILDEYTPYNEIYQNLLNTEDEVITDEELKIRKQTYFKEKIQEKLQFSKNTKDMEIYELVKSL